VKLKKLKEYIKVKNNLQTLT